MRRNRAVESGHDRLELATEAGYPKVSLGSVLAGILVAYGAFAILAAIGGGILSALGVDVRAFSDNDWRRLGAPSGAVVALVLFLSYLYGGYVAGRMARRAGAVNGVLVFVLGILVAAGVGAAIGSQTGVDGLVDNLRSIGVPTSSEQLRAIGTIAGLGSLVAMLLGSMLGGIMGERWHGKLLARALDPAVGGTADVVVDRETSDRTVEVRSDGHHFADARDENVVDDDATRPVDVTDTTSTLDDDLSPETTRTMR